MELDALVTGELGVGEQALELRHEGGEALEIPAQLLDRGDRLRTPGFLEHA